MLTNASAVARYVGAGEVTAAHVLDALAILLGEKQMEDLGRPVSPLVRRPSTVALDVGQPVRKLVQRWFDQLGNDPMAVLDEGDVAALRADLAQISG